MYFLRINPFMKQCYTSAVLHISNTAFYRVKKKLTRWLYLCLYVMEVMNGYKSVPRPFSYKNWIKTFLTKKKLFFQSVRFCSFCFWYDRFCPQRLFLLSPSWYGSKLEMHNKRENINAVGEPVLEISCNVVIRLVQNHRLFMIVIKSGSCL